MALRSWKFNQRFVSEAPKATPGPRPVGAPGSSALQSGRVSHVLFRALKDRAQRHGTTITHQREASGIGVSTLQKLRDSKPIRLSTVQTVCNYLGTDMRNVLTKYQQES
jgi:DNA-binding Xre family transcriptional regulator